MTACMGDGAAKAAKALVGCGGYVAYGDGVRRGRRAVVLMAAGSSAGSRNMCVLSVFAGSELPKITLRRKPVTVYAAVCSRLSIVRLITGPERQMRHLLGAEKINFLIRGAEVVASHCRCSPRARHRDSSRRLPRAPARRPGPASAPARSGQQQPPRAASWRPPVAGDERRTPPTRPKTASRILTLTLLLR